MQEAKLVAHHDDPPCEHRLVNGYCPVCKLYPDTQSKALWYYCPDCNVPLCKLHCPDCGKRFVRP